MQEAKQSRSWGRGMAALVHGFVREMSIMIDENKLRHQLTDFLAFMK